MSKKALTLKELQTIELEILKAYHDFCVEHNLTYYLDNILILL